MDFRIFTEPQQGATYDDLLAVAQATERLGFSAFFRSDHFLTMEETANPGQLMRGSLSQRSPEKPPQSAWAPW